VRIQGKVVIEGRSRQLGLEKGVRRMSRRRGSRKRKGKGR
jgi:hypothetical protein